MKGNKKVYIIGSIVVGVCSLLIVLFGILLFSEFDGSDNVLTFVSDTREFIYDGNEHTAKNCSLVEGNLRRDHTVTATYTGAQTEVGKSENSFSVIITNSAGQDVTQTYTVVLQAGELTVNPRPLKVITASAEKYFDGEPLTEKSWDYSGLGVLGGNYLSVSVTGEQRGIGTSKNVATVDVFDYRGNCVTHNYALELVEGDLTIKGIPVRISTKSATKVYDGDPLVCAEWSLNSTLVEGDYIDKIVMPATITERGATENYVSELIIRKSNGEIADYYEIIYTCGTLAVNPRTLTVRSGDAAKDYDGTPLTCDEWDVVSLTKPVEGHSLSVAVSGTRTEAGESANVIAQIVVTDAAGKDVTYNYEIARQEGALVVHGNSGGSYDPVGSGSAVGGGGASLDTSGSIGGNIASETRPALRIYSDSDGKVYLRLKSFGSYTGSGWLEAEDYGALLDSRYSPNYLAGISLSRLGIPRTHARIESLSGDYLLPAYLDTSEGDYEIQTGDAANVGDTSKVYSLFCYLYEYGGEAGDLTGYESYENAYYSFVVGNYLGVPATDREYMLSVISDNGWSASDPDIISKVASYIQSAAAYNRDYSRALDREPSVAVAFLRDYKEGVCQHYASAATLLFRTLGLPARYTIGYATQTRSGIWTQATTDDAHAWVEVYVRGFGWITVEVTGSNGGNVNSDKVLLIKPVDMIRKYDGTTLVHSGEIQGLGDLLGRGFTYEATVYGTQSTVGKSESRITSFTLYNVRGEDVTDEYNIVKKTGVLQLYVNELTVTTGGATSVYSNMPLTRNEAYYEGNLMVGHTVRWLEATGRLDSVGKCDNTFKILIVDESGNDVTDMYKINAVYGELIMYARNLTIRIDSATKKYDGTPLTCRTFTIYEGTVFNGSIEVVISGSQTAVGYSENTAVSYKITDAEGNDVTFNYSVTFINGTLTVTP